MLFYSYFVFAQTQRFIKECTQSTVLCIWPQDFFVFSCVFLSNGMPEYTTTACMQVVTLCYFFVAAVLTLPLHPWPPGLTCRRVRELEEELRLMDQNLKSMVCGEEEVVIIQNPPRSNSDLLPSAPLTCKVSACLSVFCLTCTCALWHQARPLSWTKRISLVIFCFPCQQIPW